MKYTDAFNYDSCYHVFNHAVGSESLFKNEENYRYFLNKYAHYILPVARTFSYCLMPNHFHFFVKFRQKEIVLKHAQLLNKEVVVEQLESHRFLMQQWSNFLNSYTKSFNKVYKRRGALFLDYTRRVEVSDPRYFRNLVCYIHNNPVKHGFCQCPEEWKFSSYTSLIKKDHSTKIERNTLLEWFNNGNKSIESHHQDFIRLPEQYAIDE